MACAEVVKGEKTQRKKKKVISREGGTNEDTDRKVNKKVRGAQSRIKRA